MTWTHRREKNRVVQVATVWPIVIDARPELAAFIATQRGDGQWVLRILSQDGQVDHRLFDSIEQLKRVARTKDWTYLRTYAGDRVHFQST